MVNSLVGAFRGNASFRPRAEPRDKQRTEGDDAKWYCELDESGDGSSPNGRFLRHRFSPKPKVIATANSLPKRNHVAKEAVSAARQTKTRQRSERICKPCDAPRTKLRPCVKTMLCVTCAGEERQMHHTPLHCPAQALRRPLQGHGIQANSRSVHL